MASDRKQNGKLPADLALAVHVTPGDTYEWSQVLLARATFDGRLQLLTAAWEQVLGYGRREIAGHTLGTLLRSAKPAAIVAAILDEHSAEPVDVTLRCRSGAAKRFRLHRRFDDYQREVFIVAEKRSSVILGDAEEHAVPASLLRPPIRLTR